MPITYHPEPHQIVTASDLVRHFGEWQDRALREPVYVLHRGRPRLVMTSIALMDVLCDAVADREAGFAAVASNGRMAVVRLDREGAFDRPDPTLAALAGRPFTALAGGRLIDLIVPEHAPAVADAIVAVVSDGVSRVIDSVLDRRDQPPIGVRIGLAARQSGDAISGAVAALTAYPAG